MSEWFTSARRGGVRRLWPALAVCLLVSACGPSVPPREAEQRADAAFTSLLEDPGTHPEVAGDAALALAHVADKVDTEEARARAAAALLEGLDHADAGVRLKCVQALGRLAHPSALPALDSLAASASPLIRIEVAVARHRMGRDDALPWLLEQLDDSRPLVERTAAAAAVGRAGEASAAPVLRALVEEAPPRVLFSSAILALGRLKDHASIPKLGDLLAHTPDVMVGSVLVQALGLMEHPDADAHIESAFRNSTHYLLQERCIETLAERRSAGLAEDLRTLLRSSNVVNARTMAARFLGQLEDSTAVPILMAAFRGDPSEGVQLAAARALVGLGKGLEIAPELEVFLDSADEDVKIEAAKVLAGIPDPRRLHALRETLMWDPVPGVKIAAAGALGGIPSADAARSLQTAFGKAADPELQLEIVRSLGRIPVDEAGDILTAILEKAEYARLKVALLEGLSRSGDVGRLDVVLRYLDDHQPGVRLQAAAGVYRLTRGLRFQDLKADS